MDIPVSKIKRRSVRRAAIVLGYVPIMVASAIMAMVVGLHWLAGAQVILATSAAREWRKL